MNVPRMKPEVTRSRVAKHKLTQREIEVLQLIDDGCSSKEAADKLRRSKRTIDFHLANIYKKLGVGNRIKAIKIAKQNGEFGSANPA